MSYTLINWQPGDTITADKLNQCDLAVARVEENLIELPYATTSATSRGITFTANDDGSISYTGTPSSDAYPYIEFNKYIHLKAGRYTMKGGSDLYGGFALLFFDDSACNTMYSGTSDGLTVYNGSTYVFNTQTGGYGNATNLYGYNHEFTIESDAYLRIQCRTVNNTVSSAISGTIYPRLERGINA